VHNAPLPSNEGRDVVHPRVETAAIAAKVVCEDRLPDRRQEPRYGKRAAEDLMEGAPDLEG